MMPPLLVSVRLTLAAVSILQADYRIDPRALRSGKEHRPIISREVSDRPLDKWPCHIYTSAAAAGDISQEAWLMMLGFHFGAPVEGTCSLRHGLYGLTMQIAFIGKHSPIFVLLQRISDDCCYTETVKLTVSTPSQPWVCPTNTSPDVPHLWLPRCSSCSVA
jgi:hypothetical protein